MMTIVILAKNWRRVQMSPDKDIAWFKCPMCGRVVSLANHTVGKDGRVKGIVACPFKCGLNNNLFLDDWPWKGELSK